MKLQTESADDIFLTWTTEKPFLVQHEKTSPDTSTTPADRMQKFAEPEIVFTCIQQNGLRPENRLRTTTERNISTNTSRKAGAFAGRV